MSISLLKCYFITMLEFYPKCLKASTSRATSSFYRLEFLMHLKAIS